MKPDTYHLWEHLTTDEHGIWQTDSTQPVAYPSDGNEQCFDLEDTSFWFQHRNDCIAAAVNRFPPQGLLMDVGGGNGFVTRRLHDEGFSTVLLEPGPAGALNAKTKRQLPNVICGTFEAIRIPQATLPAVGLFDVLEHIVEDATFLRGLHGALEPGGLLYLTVPAHKFLWSSSDVHAQHCRRYTRCSLNARLTRAGYTVLYSTYFFRPLVLPIVLLRSIPYRLGVSGQRNLLSDEKEHGTGGGGATYCVTRLLKPEVARIRRGKSMRVGASLLVVARNGS